MLTWQSLRSTFIDEPHEHWELLQRSGFDCPLEVFTQLFHEQLGRQGVPAMTADIDWNPVHWSIEELSGEELRQVYIDRRFERAVDEAYVATVREGLSDARLEVITAWRVQQTWLVPPVLIAGEVMGRVCRYALLIGNSRLGNLFGLLERGEVPPEGVHRVWMGRPGG